MADVAIARCAGYAEVSGAVEKAVLGAGGLDWVRPDMKIALKVNLVSGSKPEACATTHPAVVQALCAMLVERGAQAFVGDSPGGLYNALYVNRIYAATGMREVEQAGAHLNQDFSKREAEFSEGVVLRKFQYTAWLDRADAVVNVCKLKTHGMMSMSAGAKNMFGAIPGTIKPEYHYQFSDSADFGDMIVDINDFVKPRLTLCDAVVGMEGNGPTAGSSRFIGAIFAAENPHALDLVCAHMIGLSAEEIPTLMAARRRGYIPDSLEDLDIDGELFQISDFEKVDGHRSIVFSQPFRGPLGKLAGKFVESALSSFPVVDNPLCIGCKKCKEICPPKAIAMRNGVPAIDRKACIRCFCCQEFCPKGAIKVKRTAIAKLLSR